jgi:hypothetical protein
MRSLRRAKIARKMASISTNFVFPFAFSIFGFVSDFDIRISDLPGAFGSGFARLGIHDGRADRLRFLGRVRGWR